MLVKERRYFVLFLLLLMSIRASSHTHTHTHTYTHHCHRLLIRATIQLLTWFVAPIHHIRGFNGNPGRYHPIPLRITPVTTVIRVGARTLGAGPAVGRRVAVATFITDFERVWDGPRGCRDTRPTKRRRPRGDGTVRTRPSPASGYFLRLG